jgi:hypothetical protein
MKCDICQKPRAKVRVNSKFRHVRCWPAYSEAENYFDEINDRRGLKNYKRKLEMYEREMKAVQCCSKSIYEVLKLTKNRGLALAFK